MQALEHPLVIPDAVRWPHPRGGEVTQLFSMDTADHPDELAPDVRALLGRAEASNAEFGVDWYRNLVDTVYPDHRAIRFFVLRKGREPIVVLPLRIEPGAGGKRVHSLSNFYTTLYAPAVEQGTTAYEMQLLLTHVARAVGGFSSMTFAPMDTGSYAYATLLGALRLSHWKAFEYFTFGNWHLPVTANWADYLKTRKGGLRSTLKRMDKKLGNAGGKLEIVTGGERLEAAIAAYESVYNASWKVPEPFPEFMPGLIRSCAANGSLRMGVAWLDDKPIAAQLWIVSAGRAAIYKMAYHQDYKDYSSGSLLTAMLMQHSLDVDQVSEVDYLCGDDAYKSTWMTHRRERGGIIAYNPFSLGGLRGLARQVLGVFVRTAKQRLAAWRAERQG